MREVTMMVAVLYEDDEWDSYSGRVAVGPRHTRKMVLNLFKARIEKETGKKVQTITVVSENDPEVDKALRAHEQASKAWDE